MGLTKGGMKTVSRDLSSTPSMPRLKVRLSNSTKMELFMKIIYMLMEKKKVYKTLDTITAPLRKVIPASVTKKKVNTKNGTQTVNSRFNVHLSMDAVTVYIENGVKEVYLFHATPT